MSVTVDEMEPELSSPMAAAMIDDESEILSQPLLPPRERNSLKRPSRLPTPIRSFTPGTKVAQQPHISKSSLPSLLMPMPISTAQGHVPRLKTFQPASSEPGRAWKPSEVYPSTSGAALPGPAMMQKPTSKMHKLMGFIRQFSSSTRPVPPIERRSYSPLLPGPSTSSFKPEKKKESNGEEDDVVSIDEDWYNRVKNWKIKFLPKAPKNPK